MLEKHVSDIAYADITNYFLLLSLNNWKTTDLVIFHFIESFQYQIITLDANNLAKRTY